MDNLTHAITPCEGEQYAFEKWAEEQDYDMHEHPLHYLFMDKQTNAARQGWKAALAYVQSVLDGAVPMYPPKKKQQVSSE